MTITGPIELGVVVDDIEEMVRFYVDGLGCSEVQRAALPPSVTGPAGLGLDDVEVVWLETPRGERLKLLALQEPSRSPAKRSHLASVRGLAYLTFTVDDLEATCARLVDAGGAVVSSCVPVVAGPGTTLVFLTDPEGNGVELIERHDITP